jgi:hypothetical protein
LDLDLGVLGVVTPPCIKLCDTLLIFPSHDHLQCQVTWVKDPTRIQFWKLTQIHKCKMKLIKHCWENVHWMENNSRTFVKPSSIKLELDK